MQKPREYKVWCAAAPKGGCFRRHDGHGQYDAGRAVGEAAASFSQCRPIRVLRVARVGVGARRACADLFRKDREMARRFPLIRTSRRAGGSAAPAWGRGKRRARADVKQLGRDGGFGARLGSRSYGGHETPDVSKGLSCGRGGSTDVVVDTPDVHGRARF